MEHGMATLYVFDRVRSPAGACGYCLRGCMAYQNVRKLQVSQNRMEGISIWLLTGELERECWMSLCWRFESGRAGLGKSQTRPIMFATMLPTSHCQRQFGTWQLAIPVPAPDFLRGIRTLIDEGSVCTMLVFWL
jgi:hypothetical protein